MNFRASDFKPMRWKVHGINNLTNLEKAVKDVPEFRRVNKDRRVATIKYFAYMYDANSPMLRRITDVKERKKEAATLSGLNLTDETDYKYAEQLWRLTQSLYREIVQRMLRNQHSRLISKIVAQEIYFEECRDKMITEIDSDSSDKDILEAMKKKASLSEEMDKIDARLNRYYAELNSGDPEVEEKIDVVNLDGYRPEAIAGATVGFGT